MSDSGSRMGAVDRAQVRPSAAVLPPHRGFTCLDVRDQVARHAVCSVRIEGVRGSTSPQLHPVSQVAGLRSGRQMMQPCLGPDRLRPAASNRPGSALPAYGMPGTPQVKNQYCARICARDAAGQAETGEMERHAHEHERLVGRGNRAYWRLTGTPETGVVVLITQRSQVQILPPLPGKTASGSWIPGPFSDTCDQRSGHK